MRKYDASKASVIAFLATRKKEEEKEKERDDDVFVDYKPADRITHSVTCRAIPTAINISCSSSLITNSQSTQVPLINKLPDNKLTGCLINNQRPERAGLCMIWTVWTNPQPAPSQRRRTCETPQGERLFKAACTDVNRNSLICHQEMHKYVRESEERKRGKERHGEKREREIQQEKKNGKKRKERQKTEK